MPPEKRPTCAASKTLLFRGQPRLHRPAPKKGLYLRKQDLRRGIELMFFAYRDFTGEADKILWQSWGWAGRITG